MAPQTPYQQLLYTAGLAIIPKLSRSLVKYAEAHPRVNIDALEYITYGEAIGNIVCYRELGKHFALLTQLLEQVAPTNAVLMGVIALNYSFNSWLAKMGLFCYSSSFFIGVFLRLTIRFFMYRTREFIPQRFNQALLTFVNNVEQNRQNFTLRFNRTELISSSARPTVLTLEELDEKCPVTSAYTRRDDVTQAEDYQKIKDREQTECNVCLEQCTDAQLNRILPCQHLFHCACVDSWLMQRRSCPVCRDEI